jgi:5-methylcytosine-specific restriction endonuclease McrA
MEVIMQTQILTLDLAGLPQAWVEIEEAITYHAKRLVAWSAGNHVCAYRGGIQHNGCRSRIETRSILALRGTGHAARLLARVPLLSNDLLYARDRQLCAYCGNRYGARELSCDHVMPVSKGGKHAWMNAVTACRACNGRKADRRRSRRACRCCMCRIRHPGMNTSSCETGISWPIRWTIC